MGLVARILQFGSHILAQMQNEGQQEIAVLSESFKVYLC